MTTLLRPLVADRSWPADAACRPGTDVPTQLWDAGDETARAAAVHVCRTHCPVMADCHAEAQLFRDTPDKYRSMVVGGVVYEQNGNVSRRKSPPVRCPLCTFLPARWPHTDAEPDSRPPRDETWSCGTEAGHSRHRRRKERACDLCRQAHNDYTSKLKRDQRRAAREAAA